MGSTSSVCAARRPRIGLVLGAGGVVGASYLAGALEGVRRATGWEASQADLVVGTSAGAFIGAIAATDVPTALVYARCTGEVPAGCVFSPELVALGARMDRPNEAHWSVRYRPPLRLPRPLLASPRLAREAWRASHPAMFATGALGEGVLSSQRSIGAVVRAALAEGWPARPTWVVACDLDAGRRVVFGRGGAPTIDLDDAVSAATAIPGMFAPVRSRGKRYCDAGLLSPSNLDLVAGEDLDAIVCINPLSGAEEAQRSAATRGALGSVLRRVDVAMRRWADARLAAERDIVEREGVPVFVLHPSAEDIASFPANSMDLGARPGIMRRAAESVEARLERDRTWRDVAALLARVAAGATADATVAPAAASA